MILISGFLLMCFFVRLAITVFHVPFRTHAPSQKTRSSTGGASRLSLGAPTMPRRVVARAAPTALDAVTRALARRLLRE